MDCRSHKGHLVVLRMGPDYPVLSLRMKVAGDIPLLLVPEVVHALLREPLESPLLRTRSEEGRSLVEKVERVEGVGGGVAQRDRMERDRWLGWGNEDLSICTE